MSTSVDNIGRKEALLLLHLLGELPPEERASVDQMLSGDATLRAMYEQLRLANDAINVGMKRLDSAEPFGDNELSAISRRTARAMSQQQVELSVKPIRQQTNRRWRPSASAITSAAVAVMLVGALFFWWGSRKDPTTLPDGMAINTGSEEGQSDDGSPLREGRRDDRDRRGQFPSGRPMDRIAESAVEGLEAAFDGQTFAANRGVTDAETQFDRLHEIGQTGRDDFSAIANQ